MYRHFLSIVFPLSDLRNFFPTEETQKLAAPPWPVVKPDKDFIRGMGGIKPRKKGYAEGFWQGEGAYCEVGNYFSLALGRGIQLPDKQKVNSVKILKRFYHSGSFTSRLEISFLFNFKKNKDREINFSSATASLLSYLLGREISIDGSKKKPKLCDLGSAFAKDLLKKTTRTGFDSWKNWWMEAGEPLIFLYSHPNILPAFINSESVYLEALSKQGVDVFYDNYFFEDRPFKLFLVSRNDREKSTAALARSLKINLVRLHCEREALRTIIRNIILQKVDLEKGTPQSEGVQQQLKKTMSVLLSQKQQPIRNNEILDYSFRLDRIVNTTEINELLETIKTIRPNILKRIRALIDAQEDTIRKTDAEADTHKDQLKQDLKALVEKGDFEKLIYLIQSFVADEKTVNDFLLLSMQFQKNEKDHLLNLIDYQQYSISRSKAIHGALFLIDEVEFSAPAALIVERIKRFEQPIL